MLRRCQVINKPVISCLTGKQLGLVSHLLIDPSRLTVASLALRPKGFGKEGTGSIDLSDVVQVGDVVLVSRPDPSDDARLYMVATRRGYQRLNGCVVFSHTGTPLGKVNSLCITARSSRAFCAAAI